VTQDASQLNYNLRIIQLFSTAVSHPTIRGTTDLANVTAPCTRRLISKDDSRGACIQLLVDTQDT
jgi:hypothetical protein